MKCAQVYLIGSGPGDPGLLTLRGAACLAASDVVLYDGLSNVAMLSHAPNAQHICVGKHGQSRIWKQEEIIAEMLQHVSHGKTVARLKGGDPAVFARTAEEVDALKAAEIPFEIVPGITAALAAGSYAGIPVTHRKWASAVALVTGHEEPDKPESALDWDALAKFPGTLVIYMGVTTAETWTRALLDAGKPADTPAAILRRVSLPDQQSIHCRLDEVTDHLTPASKFRPPAIVILGAVTKLAETMSWFEHRPLFGTRILVTRPENQSEELAAGLRELGAEVTSQPAITISAPESWDEVDRCLNQITAGDTLVFASRNGVRFLAKRWTENGLDARHFAGVRIAAVGTRTAEALQEHGLRADIVPDDFTAEGLASTLSPDAQDRRFWLIRASRGRNVLAETLQNAGGNVDQIVTYRNEDTAVADPHIADQLQQGSFDWVTVTSSAIARSLHNLYGDALFQTKLASISPITTQTLSEIDSLNASPVAAEATTFTMAGLIEAILKHKQES
ncbi:Uroporphyrinogen-III C-methyltransferase [Roseimaritima multifibrata]|uniref:uroporphyrinogen-III C-methyltransferase n=1 Tax=Roseimaritima multifibrata TaxID=1930274 RepID=A0A517MNG5_9BACT|nr:uroporphyrinogen-III C-methyltransferase [Roseimaritima multifibrata]QDS96422.1 Uroporphyrinogen-III C-methyltransferase [Roseimaritima multifibrata]